VQVSVHDSNISATFLGDNRESYMGEFIYLSPARKKFSTHGNQNVRDS